MKNLIKTTLLLLAVSTTALAQNQQHRSPEERAAKQTQRMEERLGLTPEQKGRVYEINLFYARDNDHANDMKSGPDKRNEKQAIAHDKNADMKAVLTGEQFQKYQQMVAEHREKIREHRMMK